MWNETHQTSVRTLPLIPNAGYKGRRNENLGEFGRKPLSETMLVPECGHQLIKVGLPTPIGALLLEHLNDMAHQAGQFSGYGWAAQLKTKLLEYLEDDIVESRAIGNGVGSNRPRRH
jgi:hypothetical protein